MKSEANSIFKEIENLRGEYQNLILDALREGLSVVSKVKDSGKYIGTHYEYPTLSFNTNGLPSLSTSFGTGALNYRGCFDSYIGAGPLIDENELPTFNKLVEFVRSNKPLRRRFTLPAVPEVSTEVRVEIDKIQIISGVKDSIDRYIHENQSFLYTEDLARTAVAPTVSYIFDRELGVDICVPVLFLKFAFDSFQLAQGVAIERISESQHKARFGISSHNTSVHKHVMNSATHALVLKGWSVENSDHMWHFNVLSKAKAFPIADIDQFFAALRIHSSVPTGYAQVYTLANGWAAYSTANLPHLQGVTVRAYPSWFEDYYWNNEEVPTISSEMMCEIKAIFNQIQSAKENAIKLALKRLNRCLVRDDEEDAILDATIALEALLSDGNQEMTHKLALRVGALMKLEENPDAQPAQAFSDVKKIYGYRSEIVHGSKGSEKKRLIKITEEKSVPAHSLLIDYLKITLRVLLRNEKYRVPKTIDEELLLG